MVIGNPLIADAALQPGGIAVLTGKGFGETNLMALDHGGNVLFEKTVRVLAPRDAVVVYRGSTARDLYLCAESASRRSRSAMLDAGIQSEPGAIAGAQCRGAGSRASR